VATGKHRVSRHQVGGMSERQKEQPLIKRDLTTLKRPSSGITDTLDGLWDRVVAGSPYLSNESGAAAQVMLLRMRLEVSGILTQLHHEAIDLLDSAYQQADHIVEEARLEANEMLIVASESIVEQRYRPEPIDRHRAALGNATWLAAPAEATPAIQGNATIQQTETIQTRTEIIQTRTQTLQVTAELTGARPNPLVAVTPHSVTTMPALAAHVPGLEWGMANPRLSDREYPGQLDETDQSWLVELRSAMDDDGPLDDLAESPTVLPRSGEDHAGEDHAGEDHPGEDQARRRPWRRVRV
jgi:hypothetical protein